MDRAILCVIAGFSAPLANPAYQYAQLTEVLVSICGWISQDWLRCAFCTTSHDTSLVTVCRNYEETPKLKNLPNANVRRVAIVYESIAEAVAPNSVRVF